MRVALIPTGDLELIGLPRALANLFGDEHEFYSLRDSGGRPFGSVGPDDVAPRTVPRFADRRTTYPPPAGTDAVIRDPAWLNWRFADSARDYSLVEGDGPAGHGVVHLTPDQARYLHDRLTQITLAFLHENVWGGEDARAQ